MHYVMQLWWTVEAWCTYFEFSLIIVMNLNDHRSTAQQFRCGSRTWGVQVQHQVLSCFASIVYVLFTQFQFSIWLFGVDFIMDALHVQAVCAAESNNQHLPSLNIYNAVNAIWILNCIGSIQCTTSPLHSYWSVFTTMHLILGTVLIQNSY